VPDPVLVARADHPISRKNIDHDALRVLYRLHEHRYTAYLVGGSVRDLLLGRPPKDFDIGTSAHPYQIKKLFRNCWIIGRRFRLAHIKYGTKTIEVATFRKNIPDAPAEGPPEESVIVASSPAPDPPDAPDTPSPAAAGEEAATPGVRPGSRRDHAASHHENTFGTPEEDAFRRDFTVNGLFYDIGTFSVIDYVGGLQDLERRVIRSIGDPRVRFVEDPVRMLRAAVLGARLGFELDPLVVEAIDEHRALIATASPSRLIEEYYKILRSGCAEASFRALGRLRLLELMTPELKAPSSAVWDTLARLDRYRQRFPSAPPELTNTILIGSLLVPSGLLTRPLPHSDPRGDRVSFGMMPVAKKDVERLRQVVQITPRLTEPDLPPRLVRSIVHRPSFDDALTWLEIFNDAPDALERWKEAKQQRPPRSHPPRQPHGGPRGPHGHPHPSHPPRNRGDAHAQPGTDTPAADGHHPAHPAGTDGAAAPRRRRRRRRGRRRGGGGGGATGTA
jgi:poly(A) polymerase